MSSFLGSGRQRRPPPLRDLDARGRQSRPCAIPGLRPEIYAPLGARPRRAVGRFSLFGELQTSMGHLLCRCPFLCIPAAAARSTGKTVRLGQCAGRQSDGTAMPSYTSFAFKRKRIPSIIHLFLHRITHIKLRIIMGQTDIRVKNGYFYVGAR